jgi:hypothetical protein
MEKITESSIEKFAIKLLESSDYQYIYAPSVAPDVNQAPLPLRGTEKRGIQ